MGADGVSDAMLFEGELPVVRPFRQAILPGEEREVPRAIEPGEISGGSRGVR